MSSLQVTKTYGLDENLHTLAEKTRTRIVSETPHQAPQRERVSRALVPPSKRPPPSAGRGGRSSKQGKSWKERIDPNENLGVPTLMLLLEPKIVFDHVKSYVPALRKEMEASVTPGSFYEGWHRQGRLAYGVYEGAYWELMGDCEELMEMLKKMASAPPLMEEPALELPSSPDLPKWEDYKPSLLAVPPMPEAQPLRLPPYKAPMLLTELPFVEPEYLPEPNMADVPKEEALPDFQPPVMQMLDPFKEPEFNEPRAPALRDAPKAPPVTEAKYGHDWSGERPFRVPDAAMPPVQLAEVPAWVHPPGDLPPPPATKADLGNPPRPDLEAQPLVELAWVGGPDPDPPYASASTTPGPSPGPSRNPSRPISAARPASRPASRPVSALRPGSPPRPVSAGPGRPLSAVRPVSAKSSRIAEEGPDLEPYDDDVYEDEPEEAGPEPQWEDLQDVEGTGAPRLWLNFEPPFAEPAPVVLPDRPGPRYPEPLLDDYLPKDLKQVPAFVAPLDDELPAFVEPPPFKEPEYVAPCEPRPIGFLRGVAPVIIMDVSGTMSPALRGCFKEEKSLVVQLLDPRGELATSAQGFDVIAFSNGAYSWSATYESRQQLLRSSQVQYAGRQAGGKVQRGVSARGVADKSKAGLSLQPTEAEFLQDAQHWVDRWPEATGHTNLLAGFRLAGEHWAADCWYLLSDGLANDASLCIDFLEKRRKQGLPVPVVHTVGFPPDNAGDNFTGERFLKDLAALTGGTYQRYQPGIMRIYKDGKFQEYDPSSETQEQKEERAWVEEQLRLERKKNGRLGIAERIEVTLERIRTMYRQNRVVPLMQAHEREAARARSEHRMLCVRIANRNAERLREAREAHDALVAQITAENDAKESDARARWQENHDLWAKLNAQDIADWVRECSKLESAHAAEVAAYETLAAQRDARVAAERESWEQAQQAGRQGRTSGRPQPLTRRAVLTAASSAAAAAAPGDGAAALASARVGSAHSSQPSSGAGAGPGSIAEASLRPGSAAGGARPTSARPLSGRPFSASSRPYSASSSARPGSARSTASAALPPSAFLQSLPQAVLAQIAPGADLTEEQSRKLVPPEVIADIDLTNYEALQEAKDDFKLLTESDAEREKRERAIAAANAARLEEYEAAVLDVYATSFAAEVACGAAVVEAANAALLADAAARYAREQAAVDAENARLAALHAEECAEKAAKDREYAAALAKWESERSQILAIHGEQVARAREGHRIAVERAQRDWQRRKEDLDAANEALLEQAKSEHEKLVTSIRERNKVVKVQQAEVLRQKRLVEKENALRLAEAKVQHKQNQEQLGRDNEAALAQSEVDHQELCSRLKAEYEADLARLAREHDEMKVEVGQRNEVLMDEARRLYQDAMVAAQEAYELQCREARAAYEEALAKVRVYNEGVWPQVQLAQLAELELGRVKAFFEHIHYCANKVGAIGVNFYKDMPCYDRVVEMSALVDALAKAYPDMAPPEYPWPGHERKQHPGTGWHPSPVPPSITSYRDPALDVQLIATGKRPASAGIRFSNREEANLSTGRPQTASARVSFRTGTAALAGSVPASPKVSATDQLQLLRQSVDSAEGGLESRSHSLRSSISRQMMQQDVSQGGSARPASARPASAGPQYAGARPQSAAAEGARFGSSAKPPPSASARGALPARKAADTQRLMSALNKFAHSTGSKLGGTNFVKDMPRVQYPEVDVQLVGLQ